MLQPIARAVWRRDCRTAAALISTNSLAAKHPALVDVTSCLTFPESFQAEFANLKPQQLGEELAVNKSGKSAAGDAAASQKMLWFPSGKSLRLSALRSADGTVARNRDGVADALAAAWGPKLAPTSID